MADMPSIDAWLREAKADPSFRACGMYMVHNGTVRETPKAEARGIETDGVQPGDKVTGMVFSYDEAKVAAAVEEARALPGIGYVRVWLNSGELAVGVQPGDKVTGMVFSYDEAKVAAAVEEARALPGIGYVRVWLNSGELAVGDDIMLVLIGGDIRPRVIDGLQHLVATIKNTSSPWATTSCSCSSAATFARA